MTYSSETYKQMLLNRLYRDFSMPSPADRAYTYNIYVKIFEGVDMTEDIYNQFIAALDKELQYCSNHNFYEAQDLGFGASAKDLQEIIAPAFKLCGIDIAINQSLFEGTITFTKSDGTVIKWLCHPDQGDTQIFNDFRINCRAGREFDYSDRCRPYYDFYDEPPSEAIDLDPHRAGPGLTWSYLEADTTLTVSGTGAYAGVVQDDQLNCGQYTTLILGADIYRLLQSCLGYKGTSQHTYTSLNKIVFLRDIDAPLILDTLMTGDITAELDIYADNKIFRAYEFPSTLTVHWHTLSEWEG